ncbi:alpha/beta hydrolase family protein [Streptosporangium sp. NPDC001559]|uniref:alpha/beta hydrolase family protein n=1 Tax=Streptosporangium sp. NPDC001559 TaxID=3366187 RepID=UPI0036E4EDA7
MQFSHVGFRSGRWVALAALITAAVTLTAGLPAPVADAAVSVSSPARHLGIRGSVLSVRPLTGPQALPSASRNLLVTYVSRGVAGKAIRVTGTVALPKGRPPANGWPVISWAHGTTGTADACAPSRNTSGGPADDYIFIANTTLDGWVANGFAVAQTDYEGLGTPGEHPYMNGASAADTVIDMVRAARRVDRRVGRDWFAVGHSQGGHAALFTAMTQNAAGDVRLRGAVSIAPGGWDMSQVAPYILSGAPGADQAIAFLPTLLIGAAAADGAVDPGRLLTPEAAPLLTTARSGCMAQIRETAARIPADRVFAQGADLAPLTAYLRSQEPVGLETEVPTLVAQGSADALTPKASTDRIVAGMCAKASKVTYRVYEGVDHRGSIAASFNDALAFVELIRSGRTPVTTC